MADKSHRYFWISLLVVSLFNIGSDEAFCDSIPEAAATSLNVQNQHELQPPDWQIGDRWVVETEIFDQGGIMKGSDVTGWTEKQAWIFEVLGTDSIDNRRCHHLQISPINGNTCPYTFALWLSIADLQLNAFQIVYPPDNGSSNRHRPRSARKHLSRNGAPDDIFDYLKARFPTLPLWLLPQFNRSMAPSASSATRNLDPPTKVRQTITTHSAPLPIDQAAAPLLPQHLAKTSNGPYHKVTLAYGDAQEIQYWQNDHPWPVYGYKSGKNGMEKRYRLTDIGRIRTPE
jgi:hypothetical protein